MQPSLLRAEGLSKSFSANRVLREVSFEVRAGEVHILAGENGAGKSTLIKILAGVHQPDEGSLWLNGKPVRFASPMDAVRCGLSVIHQELSLIGSLSVAENIFLGHEKTARRTLRQWLRPAEQYKKAAELCERLGLEVDVRKPVEDYPISVQSGIEIAKALAQKEQNPSSAPLLIMDEPTSTLSAPEVERLFGLISSLKAAGYGIIYISHKMEEIQRLADRITVLRDGACVGTAHAQDLPESELIQWMIGREMKEQFPARSEPYQPQAPVQLEVRGVEAPGVRDVSFQVRAGEVLGLAGLQGSGNSELLNAIFGSYGKLTQGQVFLDGNAVLIRSPREAIQKGLALLTNDRKATGLVLSLGIQQNITLASLKCFSRCGWLSPKKERAHALAQGQSLRIRSTSIEQEVSTLSGGNQQKVAFAKWLETHPRVLFLDEPTRGVDVGAKHEIYRLIRGLTEKGLAVVLISSEMPELLALSDRVLVMHRGRVTAEYLGSEATPEKILAAAMGREIP